MGTNKLKQTQSFTLAMKQIKVTARTDRSNASTQHFKAHVIEASNTAIWLSCCHTAWMRRPDDEAASRQTKPLIWNKWRSTPAGGHGETLDGLAVAWVQ